ncbi:MAG: hypothetical protein GY809_29975 [Planctomycetes bacterium]|nr:hypothetical protein [Planctomycetota bacterium]
MRAPTPATQASHATTGNHTTAQQQDHFSRDRETLPPAPSSAGDPPQVEVHTNRIAHHLATRNGSNDQPGHPHWHENYGLSSVAQPWLARSHRTTDIAEIQFVQSQELATP